MGAQLPWNDFSSYYRGEQEQPATPCQAKPEPILDHDPHKRHSGGAELAFGTRALSLLQGCRVLFALNLMDPLSAIASVAGIITAASEAIKVLGPFVTAAKDAPKIASQVLSEVLAVKTIVTALDQLASNLSSPAGVARIKYASLIQVDHLRAVLTDGVLLFSDLEALLQTLPPPEPSSSRARLLSSMQWVRKKGALLSLCDRLQAFKLSTNCILSILQSDSQARAEDCQKQLMSYMETILQNTQPLAEAFLGGDAEDPAFQYQVATERLLTVHFGIRRSMFERSFEKDLKASRVYRRIKRDTMDFSMRSSVARSHGWSIFSGMSLSNISDISVLALPIYPGDITNPQHYINGADQTTSKQSMPRTLPARSIYHDCVEAELELSQLTQCGFKILIIRERLSAPPTADPLSILIAVFRHGGPLLLLLKEVDRADGLLQYPWDADLSPNTSKLAVVQFVEACVSRLGFQSSECFTVTDLFGDDTTGHVKVLNLVRNLLSKLAIAGKIEPVQLNPLSGAVLSSSPSPSMLAVEELLHDERDYVYRLERLYRLKEKEGSAGEMGPTEVMFPTVRTLVDIQRRFLLRLEVLALVPFNENTPWSSLFGDWSMKAKVSYSSLVSGERAFKAALRTAAAPSRGANPFDDAVGISEAISTLSMLSHRLDSYLAFLEELAQHIVSSHLDRAKLAVLDVVETIRITKEAQALGEAKIDLITALGGRDSIVLDVVGDLLLEDTAVVTSLDTESLAVPSQLFLFEHALLHVAPRKQEKGDIPPQPRGKTAEYRLIFRYLRIVSIVWVAHMRQMNMGDGDKAGFRIIFANTHTGPEQELVVSLAIESRPSIWATKLRSLRGSPVTVRTPAELGFDEIHWSVSSIKPIEHKLVVMGGADVGKTAFLLKFVGIDADEYDPTINQDDIDHIQRVIDNELSYLYILDTTGTEQFSALRGQFLSAGHGFLLMYSITSRNSFDKVQSYYREIPGFQENGYFPMVMVGNHCRREKERQVTFNEGKGLATSIGCPFFEADVQDGYNVEAAFVELVRNIRRYNRGYRDWEVRRGLPQMKRGRDRVPEGLDFGILTDPRNPPSANGPIH